MAAPTVQDLIARHEADMPNSAVAAELAAGLEVTGPVLSDGGMIYFRAQDGTLRIFRTDVIRKARDVPWPIADLDPPLAGPGGAC